MNPCFDSGSERNRLPDAAKGHPAALDLVGAGPGSSAVGRDVAVPCQNSAAIVAAPSSSRIQSRITSDLPAHRCINFRHGSSGVYHWELTRVGNPFRSQSAVRSRSMTWTSWSEQPSMASAWHSPSRNTWRDSSRKERSFASSRSGARHLRGISSITRVAGSSPRRSRLSSRRCACRRGCRRVNPGQSGDIPMNRASHRNLLVPRPAAVWRHRPAVVQAPRLSD